VRWVRWVRQVRVREVRMNRHDFPASPIVGVGAVIVEDGKAIIIKRANDPYKGQWSIPGGRVELGEPLADAVRREMREETGLDIEVGPVIEVFERIQWDDGFTRAPDAAPRRVRYHFVIIDYLCRSTGGVLRAGDDADDAVWVTSEELERYDIRESARAVIRTGLAMAAAGDRQPTTDS
jgi:ADP-ribose pyrophosphatase YjhB (NUDIX family)